MTIATLLARLLTHFSPEERTVPDSVTYPGRNAAAIQAINGALQELFTNSVWTRRDSEGFLLFAPVTVSVTVTEGSKTVAFGAGWDTRFLGCSCRIGGATVDNRIKSVATTDATMIYPHDGPTGAADVIVWCDCLTLAANIAEVLRPVFIRGGPFLSPRPGPASLNAHQTNEEDYGFDRLVVNPITHEADMDTVAGMPQFYTVEEFQSDDYAVPIRRLRIYPAPSGQQLLSARVRYAAPNYAATDTNKVLPVPNEYVESILIPVAEQHLTRSEFFRNESAKPAIAQSYQTAINLLRSLNPQTSSGVRIRSLY